MKKKAPASGGRHNWQPEEEEELKRIFSYCVQIGKLPKLSDIDKKIEGCPTVYRNYRNGRVTKSAIKNKIDRLLNILGNKKWMLFVLTVVIISRILSDLLLDFSL